jgi:hypothetical protein
VRVFVDAMARDLTRDDLREDGVRHAATLAKIGGRCSHGSVRQRSA